MVTKNRVCRVKNVKRYVDFLDFALVSVFTLTLPTSVDNLNSFPSKHMYMTDSQKIKEKVKERYTKVALTGDSCCGSSVSFESGGGCCSGNNNTVLQPSQSAVQVSELVGYDTKETKIYT